MQISLARRKVILLGLLVLTPFVATTAHSAGDDADQLVKREEAAPTSAGGLSSVPAPVVASGPKSPTEALNAKLTHLEKMLTESQAPSLARVKAEWKELSTFHRELWRTMALDPGTLPISEVPANLQSKELTERLEKRFEDLSNSVLIEKFALQEPFANYVDVVSQILALRRAQKFISARSVAKRGLLDDAYLQLVSALEDAQQMDEALLLPLMSSDAERDLRETLASVRELAASVKKTEPVDTKASAAAPHEVSNVAKPEATTPADVAISRPERPRWWTGALSGALGFILALTITALFNRKETRPAKSSVAHPVAGQDEGSGIVPPPPRIGAGADLPFQENFDFAAWVRTYRGLVADYRRFRGETDGTANQVQPFLDETAQFFRKYYQETRESHYRGRFTDHELALNGLLTDLSGSLQTSDRHCRALMNHLAILAEAVRANEGPARNGLRVA